MKKVSVRPISRISELKGSNMPREREGGALCTHACYSLQQTTHERNTATRFFLTNFSRKTTVRDGGSGGECNGRRRGNKYHTAITRLRNFGNRSGDFCVHKLVVSTFKEQIGAIHNVFSIILGEGLHVLASWHASDSREPVICISFWVWQIRGILGRMMDA